MAKRKSRVVLVELSAKLDDGSRKTLQVKEICSCNERGTAELIKVRLKDDYKVLCKENPGDNEHMWFLSIQ